MSGMSEKNSESIRYIFNEEENFSCLSRTKKKKVANM